MHYFHLMRTRRIHPFFPLKMANNTLILQIVVDFVSKVHIFKLFSRFWRGSFCLKMFPSSKKFQVSVGKNSKRGGGHHISKKSQVSKSLKVWNIRHYFHLMRTPKQKNFQSFISKSSHVQKSPKSGRGRGCHRHLGTFPKCRRFLILKAPLRYGLLILWRGKVGEEFAGDG